MTGAGFDPRFMRAAIALSQRTRGATAPNPNVGCVIVSRGRVVGRGWTQPGGRPHAEAMALAQAGTEAAGATAYVSLEPCAHAGGRGPPCAPGLAAAGIAHVVGAIEDPDPRTAGRGFALLEGAGVRVTRGVAAAEARRAMAGFLTRRAQGRPSVTLKLATSLDGRIALASGESRWITGAEARAHAHLERSRHEAILVGRGTWEADAPKLDVRLAGLEERAPMRIVLSRADGETDQRWGAQWHTLSDPAGIAALDGVDHLLVEGGAGAAAAFLRADLVDRILLYRAPLLLGDGAPAIAAIGLDRLASAHGRWRLADARQLGVDRLEVYERARCSPA